MQMVNLQTGNIEEVKNPLAGWNNPTEDICFINGYRRIPVIPPPAAGYERLTPVTFADGDDGINAVAVYADTLIATRTDAEAAALAAQIAAVAPMASMYRAKLRQLFGPNAETNRAVTQESVAGYFLQIMATNGLLTAQQQSDETLLREGFNALASPSPGEPLNTWNFPWNLIP